MCKIAEYTDEMQMFYETKAQAVLMSCYDDQRNMAVFQAFCESEPCVGNNSENHGNMVHVKPKCLGEGLGSMRVQSVHVTHVLAEWHFSLCVSVRLPQSVRVHCTHSRRARKKPISAASSTKHRKIISLHLTGASCNADKTAKLQR